MEKMKLVVPTISQDFGKLLHNIRIYFNFLPIKEIYVVGSGELQALLPPPNYPVVFMDEKELVDFDAIKKLIVKRTKSEKDGRRAGWYVQQFIKMGFARICPDDYYLLWDSDTVPLKPMNMIEEKPVFDCKTEYHEAYFKTIERLFPNLRKCIKGSFISEHMVIKTSLMRQMLSDIEANDTLVGDNFAEKIINAVPVEELGKSGFSEFETFGTYVQSNFPNVYSMRNWKSLRSGGLFYDCSKGLSKENVSWLSRYYDAISFEKWDTLSSVSKIVASSWYEKLFRANTLEVWVFFVRVYRKIREVFVKHSEGY